MDPLEESLQDTGEVVEYPALLELEAPPRPRHEEVQLEVLQLALDTLDRLPGHERGRTRTGTRRTGRYSRETLVPVLSLVGAGPLGVRREGGGGSETEWPRVLRDPVVRDPVRRRRREPVLDPVQELQLLLVLLSGQEQEVPVV